MEKLSHIDKEGMPAMVNVGDKAVSRRTATATGIVLLPPEIQPLISGNDLIVKKGSVFQTAIIAGIMAAKKTHELIPLCHPLNFDQCDIRLQLSGLEVHISATVGIEAKTGVEMEALTAVSAAALTVYDMVKAVSHQIVIKEIKLKSKRGGKRDIG